MDPSRLRIASHRGLDRQRRRIVLRWLDAIYILNAAPWCDLISINIEASMTLSLFFFPCKVTLPLLKHKYLAFFITMILGIIRWCMRLEHSLVSSAPKDRFSPHKSCRYCRKMKRMCNENKEHARELELVSLDALPTTFTDMLRPVSNCFFLTVPGNCKVRFPEDRTR